MDGSYSCYSGSSLHLHDRPLFHLLTFSQDDKASAHPWFSHTGDLMFRLLRTAWPSTDRLLSHFPVGSESLWRTPIFIILLSTQTLTSPIPACQPILHPVQRRHETPVWVCRDFKSVFCAVVVLQISLLILRTCPDEVLSFSFRFSPYKVKLFSP